jgi:hypothetical protein
MPISTTSAMDAAHTQVAFVRYNDGEISPPLSATGATTRRCSRSRSCRWG